MTRMLVAWSLCNKVSSHLTGTTPTSAKAANTAKMTNSTGPHAKRGPKARAGTRHVNHRHSMPRGAKLPPSLTRETTMRMSTLASLVMDTPLRVLIHGSRLMSLPMRMSMLAIAVPAALPSPSDQHSHLSPSVGSTLSGILPLLCRTTGIAVLPVDLLSSSVRI